MSPSVSRIEPSAPAGPVGEITRLLRQLREGDDAVIEELLSKVYNELRRIAVRRFHGRTLTLQPTVLAHDAALRLLVDRHIEWVDRAHFFGVAARAMGQILAEHLRYRQRQKRGGGAERVALVEDLAMTAADPIDSLDLSRALECLARRDPLKAKIVKLRYFGGLTLEETAAALALSTASVGRHWRRARAWLFHTLSQDRGLRHAD